jgi:hypothetical protein
MNDTPPTLTLPRKGGGGTQWGLFIAPSRLMGEGRGGGASLVCERRRWRTLTFG